MHLIVRRGTRECCKSAIFCSSRGLARAHVTFCTLKREPAEAQEWLNHPQSGDAY